MPEKAPEHGRSFGSPRSSWPTVAHRSAFFSRCLSHRGAFYFANGASLLSGGRLPYQLCLSLSVCRNAILFGQRSRQPPGTVHDELGAMSEDPHRGPIRFCPGMRSKCPIRGSRGGERPLCKGQQGNVGGKLVPSRLGVMLWETRMILPVGELLVPGHGFCGSMSFPGSSSSSLSSCSSR